MTTGTFKAYPMVHVTAEPGICGFPCTIKAQKLNNQVVSVEIGRSECKQIQRMATRLSAMSLKELFMPLTRNPVYVAAEKSGCHSSCVIPAAVLKAVEVALEMALPRDVSIQFKHETLVKEDPETDDCNENTECRTV